MINLKNLLFANEMENRCHHAQTPTHTHTQTKMKKVRSIEWGKLSGNILIRVERVNKRSYIKKKNVVRTYKMRYSSYWGRRSFMELSSPSRRSFENFQKYDTSIRLIVTFDRRTCCIPSI